MLGACCVTALGCGFGGTRTKVVHGTVTIGGEKAQSGQVRFVPVEGTSGPANAAPIVDGQYRIDGRGGVVVGKYRVEVTATKKTGRQVMQNNGFEQVMGDEFVNISPPEYAGKQSPIVAEIAADSDGRFDIAIPR